MTLYYWPGLAWRLLALLVRLLVPANLPVPGMEGNHPHHLRAFSEVALHGPVD